jgi:hypothetical protein
MGFPENVHTGSRQRPDLFMALSGLTRQKEQPLYVCRELAQKRKEAADE